MSTFPELRKQFLESGYVVLRGAIDPKLVDRFWNEVEFNIANNPDLTYAVHGKILKNSEINGSLVQNDTILRIIDIEQHSAQAHEVMLHNNISSFLSGYYEAPPTAIQTLTYKYSSQQGAHSDLHLVSPSPVGLHYQRETLAAAWISCEDADESNGALVFYPGSHRLLKRTLADFANDYGSWVSYLDTLCRSNGCAPEVFHAAKGDVLMWHGDLVHAGGPILVPGKTRKSLVVHYCRVPDSAPVTNPQYERVRRAHGWLYVSNERTAVPA
jgi:phytanoyl-CoA hydroxylase